MYLKLQKMKHWLNAIQKYRKNNTVLFSNSNLKFYPIKYLPCETSDQAENVNPDADKSTPEVIIEGSRILGPKNQSVFCNNHCIKIIQDLSKCSILEDSLKETKICWHRS
jgi:hypothetical protein